tara:strand:- start:484 stop:828 length:345 start_codon:yes stop_codon:yes gene_type:complete
MNIFLKNNKFFLISIGAIPAALLRWQIKDIIVVNLIGSFLLGFINSLNISKRYKLIFGFGFCGSLTTFSGWSLQLFNFINEGFYKLFLVNSILIVLVAVSFAALGKLAANKIIN